MNTPDIALQQKLLCVVLRVVVAAVCIALYLAVQRRLGKEESANQPYRLAVISWLASSLLIAAFPLLAIFTDAIVLNGLNLEAIGGAGAKEAAREMPFILWFSFLFGAMPGSWSFRHARRTLWRNRLK